MRPTVYVVLRNWEHEGAEVAAVFASQIQAEAWIRAETDSEAGYFYSITSAEVA